MSHTIDALLDIMTKLRDPENGCPWDVEQTFETIAPYTIEEAYEVDEAIRDGTKDELKDELGDLLFQVVFHAQMAKEEGSFDFTDVVASISDKMIRRHPHVFAEDSKRTSEEQIEAWEVTKQKEREANQSNKAVHLSALDGVSSSLPALMRAQKLQKRAARVGFDWPDTSHVLDKIQEESMELYEAYSKDQGKKRIVEEYGDLLFVMVNLGRHLEVDVETALRDANAKFTRRFQYVEQKLSDQGKSPETSSLEEMDAYWDEIKAYDKQ
ncbi:nucleoside triphosphate pyrophosphohydrolase [Temperatibacter marinus]|uniref:Nucleoside triphosphate pyrophosphohydrolase n=1 Tax=Temperatibacter marinus TaxID=1456591 RepID=A0AA52H8V9_9PROT|nr:nucleoside triphosphate pyrophosphohydrolase [Temperatibacter marinus]WND02244.1 nucleoside triphosphate pyrophosphohydrolase [Temperatibacter marinus]